MRSWGLVRTAAALSGPFEWSFMSRARIRPQHDLPDGRTACCQVCGSHRLEPVIDLGHQPLCDSLPSTAELDAPEISYPLRQMWCRDCTLSQLDYVVPGDVVFHPDYPYRSGIARELAAHQEAFAQQ